MNDKWQNEAARLLPCEGVNCRLKTKLQQVRRPGVDSVHVVSCPARYRPAVAAALAKAAEGTNNARRIIVEPLSDEDQLRRETQTALLRKINELHAEVELYKQLWEEEKEVYKRSVDTENQLRAEVERLNLALLRIGEFAVVDFDDGTVGEVDRAIPTGLKNYGEKLRAEYRYTENLRAEVERLREQLNANCLERDALMIEVARLTAERDEREEVIVSCCKELGDAGVLITEGPKDGIVTLINERDELRAERDAAVVQGLEIAIEVCDGLPDGLDCTNAIAAEIAKRTTKGEK